MSIAKITETYLDDIADAIRFKRMESSATYTPPQMASAIMSIAGGPNAVYVTDTIDPETGGIIRTINGADISNDTVTPQTLLSGVTAHMSDGTSIVGEYEGGGGQAILQSKTVSFTPSENAIQSTITADSGFDGLSTVSVSISAISSTYVGSAVTRRTATDLTATGSTVTAPSGYYSSAVTKSIAGATTPYLDGYAIDSTGRLDVSMEIDIGGYIQANTYQMSLDGVPVQSAQTIYPSTADQTIASQRWLTGTQTIKSVITTNLSASNIVSGVTIKIGDSSNASRITQVTGTATIGTDTTDATLTSGGQMLSAYTAYAKGTKYTGTILTKTSADLTASGLVVTVPSGYYSQATTKEVSLTTGTLTSSIADDVQMMSMYAYTNSSAYFSSAKIVYFPQMTVSSATTVTVNAGGDVTTTFSPSTAGAAFTKATYTVTKQSALHIMSSSDYAFQFNGVDANNFPLITVDAENEGYQFNNTFTLTGNVSIGTQGASTYYVSTADRTIASQRWLVGAQTIKSVTTSNITASNIVSGVVVRVGDTGNASRILQVTGTAQTGTDTSDATLNNANQLVSGVTAYAGGSKYTGTLAVLNYYTGTTAPSSSLGEYGDIYLQYDDGTSSS